MKKAIFLFIAILLLIIYQEFAKADRGNSDDFLVLIFVAFLNIPTIVALFVLITFTKLNKNITALIINSLIWLPYALYLGNETYFYFINYSLGYSFFDDTYEIMELLPMTIVFILTVFVYFLNNNKSFEQK